MTTAQKRQLVKSLTENRVLRNTNTAYKVVDFLNEAGALNGFWTGVMTEKPKRKKRYLI